MRHGGHYVVVQRTPGENGRTALHSAAARAADQRHRLLGNFGASSGALPLRSASGNYDSADGVSPAPRYSPADLDENPTLADLTAAALRVLSTNPDGFWLMVEAGTVDWASHDTNLDTVIGTILSGDEAFEVITTWIEENNA